MVADENGKSVESQVRTSSSMFLQLSQDEIVSRIETKIAAWTFLPQGIFVLPNYAQLIIIFVMNFLSLLLNLLYLENGEAMQILRYELGQKYEPHFDFFHDENNLKLGGHRVATVLMYLSNVEKGGETVFPKSEAKDRQPKGDDWSD
ncbi:Probable prolyl 4-hydroxylase 7, partial [Striga hermonthica]